MAARLDDFAPNPLETGRFVISVTPEDADTVYVSESGPPDPARGNRLNGRVHETNAPAVWFLAIDSTGKNATGEAVEWRAPIRVKPDVRRVARGHKISLQVCPRSATVHATFDGSDPANAPALTKLEIEAPEGATRLRVIARVGRETSPEEVAPLATGMAEGPGPSGRPASARHQAGCSRHARLPGST